ncbi:MAG: DJ-1/PfpI family protein [Oscillospiraceae bacterium]|nr:DJ-1/PfpI family protein [Oscillospiraceae bacterium]
MVYVLLADGVEEVEAVYPIDVLRRCGIDVVTVGVTGQYVTGSNKITLKSDISIDEVSLEKHIDMLILPGGPGRGKLKENSKSAALIKHCCETGVPIAAICAAPEILGEMGYLKGKNATCYPGIEPKLIGATVTDSPVVTDGKLITAQGAGCAEAFSFAIAEFLCGAEKAREVYGKMICGKK